MIDNESPFQPAVIPARDQSQNDAALVRITLALIRADFAPGAILSESEISARTGFALAAVRTSLARLHVAGWICPLARRGWQVQGMDAGHLFELVRLRERLEPVLGDIRLTSAQRAPLRLAAQALELQGRTGPMLLQERALMRRILDLAPWARAREWLGDLWDMSLRADAVMAARGITRPLLPVQGLVDALGDAQALDARLAWLRDDFSARSRLWLAHDQGRDRHSSRQGNIHLPEVSHHAS